jgi:hypothetical protein
MFAKWTRDGVQHQFKEYKHSKKSCSRFYQTKTDQITTKNLTYFNTYLWWQFAKLSNAHMLNYCTVLTDWWIANPKQVDCKNTLFKGVLQQVKCFVGIIIAPKIMHTWSPHYAVSTKTRPSWNLYSKYRTRLEVESTFELVMLWTFE